MYVVQCPVCQCPKFLNDSEPLPPTTECVNNGFRRNDYWNGTMPPVVGCRVTFVTDLARRVRLKRADGTFMERGSSCLV